MGRPCWITHGHTQEYNQALSDRNPRTRIQPVIKVQKGKWRPEVGAVNRGQTRESRRASAHNRRRFQAMLPAAQMLRLPILHYYPVNLFCLIALQPNGQSG
ncbi:Hypothetical predicted protein [Podarcis lilfordi]|uniref:Uncharacterized protein n=1 Tax=Podarcis lilfordi TaxID=74358 RepID=A0AA35K687_9SAUR|nr:Hypothetical predicted protein [Podarcis lilfordi]